MPRRVYWDACTFLGLLNEEPNRVNACREVWEEAKNYGTLIYTSFFAFTEVMKIKCQNPGILLSIEDDKKIEQLLGQKWIRPVVVDERIAVSARRLMRTHNKKPADAIHLATALMLPGVNEMHTFDAADLLKLDGQLVKADNKPLKICTPYPLPPIIAPAVPDIFRNNEP